MRITKHRKYTVNMGNYESYTFGAEVSVSNADLGVSDEELAALDSVRRAQLIANLHGLVEDNLTVTISEEVHDISNKAPKTSKTASLSAN